MLRMARRRTTSQDRSPHHSLKVSVLPPTVPTGSPRGQAP
jgi:hypothetical protein